MGKHTVNIVIPINLGIGITGLVLALKNDGAKNTCDNGLWESMMATSITLIINSILSIISLLLSCCYDMEPYIKSPFGKYCTFLNSIISIGLFIWANVAYWTLDGVCKDMYENNFNEIYVFAFVYLIITYSLLGLVCCLGTCMIIFSN